MKPARSGARSGVPSRRSVRRARPAVAVALLATAAAGCATSPAPSRGTPQDPVIQVVAAENVWGGIASALGGRHVRVTSLIDNPAADPHDYEPTAADARATAGARYAIVNGVGYDAWATRLLSADGGHGRTDLDVGDLLGIAPGGNPHRWYSPADVHAVIARITADYKRIDPADAADFDALRTAYETTALAAYDRLVADIRSAYAGTPIGASESVVRPLADALGLRTLTPDAFLTAISEGSDPTAHDKALIDRQIADRQIRVYVYNSQNATPDVKRQVEQARKHGIPVVTLTETLTPAGASFQDWQVRQLRQLQQALATGVRR